MPSSRQAKRSRAGRPKYGTKAPETSGNLQAFYRFKGKGLTTGLRLGAGASYAGSTWVDGAQAQLTYLAQWSDAATTYWASVARDFAFSHGRRMSLSLSAHNLFDKRTITPSNNFSQPRMIKGSLAYKF
jgi:outer membrane receptor protein involved in Fe transport